MSELATLRNTVDRFARGREASIDPVGVAHAARLVTSAESGPEVARARLLVRARLAVETIAERVRAEQQRASARIESLSDGGFEIEGLRERLARGETLFVERAFRRAAVLGREPRRRDPAIEARLANLARTEGVATAPGGSLFDVAERLYRNAAAASSASLVIDRVTREKPVDAGRYHTASVAAAVLVAMRDASPAYLRTQLARLDLVGEIQRFLRSFEPIVVPDPKSKGRAKAAAKSAEASRAGTAPGARRAPARGTPPKSRGGKPEAAGKAPTSAPVETPAAPSATGAKAARKRGAPAVPESELPRNAPRPAHKARSRAKKR